MCCTCLLLLPWLSVLKTHFIMFNMATELYGWFWWNKYAGWDGVWIVSVTLSGVYIWVFVFYVYFISANELFVSTLPFSSLTNFLFSLWCRISHHKTCEDSCISWQIAKTSRWIRLVNKQSTPTLKKAFNPKSGSFNDFKQKLKHFWNG